MLRTLEAGDAYLRSKAVHACMIRLLNSPAKHEKVAIYVVNQRISNVCRIAELLRSGAIRRHQPRSKGYFDSYDTRISSHLQIYKSYLLCTQLQANIHNHLH